MEEDHGLAKLSKLERQVSKPWAAPVIEEMLCRSVFEGCAALALLDHLGLQFVREAGQVLQR